MWRGRRIAVVIPAFNEARLIRRTLSGVPSYVDRVIVVDDASQDETWAVLAPQADPRVVRIRHAHNQGVGAAIVSGYYHALRENHDVLAVMAGDNQMQPAELQLLIDAVLNGAHYAKGNRFQHASASHMPTLRRWGSSALSLLTRLVSGLQVDDCQCGYTALSARAAEALPLSRLWPRYGYPNDLLLWLAQHEARVAEVPVSAVYATEQSGLHAGHLFSIAYRIVRRARQLQGEGRLGQARGFLPRLS